VLGSNSSTVESFLNEVYRLLQPFPVFLPAAGVKRELSLLCENGPGLYLQLELKFSFRNVCDVKRDLLHRRTVEDSLHVGCTPNTETRFRLAVRTTFTKKPFCYSGSHTGYFFLAAGNYGFKRDLLALKQLRTITQSIDD